jgi:methionine-R-sulfoxide reductase
MEETMKYLILAILLPLSGHAFNPGNYKKASDEELRKSMSSIQYNVTQNEGTERPFQNPFHNLKEEGIYVDVVSGEPLFSSKDKFDSGTGWPSFSKPINDKFIKSKKEFSAGQRTEIRSKYADSHLGHVFDDGPTETGKRFCINSASLRFIPKSQLKASGYGEYEGLFK